MKWLYGFQLMVAAALGSSVVLAAESSCPWPRGMSFIGLVDGDWKMYLVEEANQPPKEIIVDTEPRTPVFSEADSSLIYVDEAGYLRVQSVKHNQTGILLEPSTELSYTQPEVDEARERVYIVGLNQGKSVDTDIFSVDMKTRELEPLVIQRSAQFEPEVVGNWLYYSNVHCVVGCGNIIQEIWRYNIVSGIAEQVTLLSAISGQPTIDQEQNSLYFSSNAQGHYHIYRQRLDDHQVSEQLTTGAFADTSPAVYQSNMYHIRQSAKGVSLMCLSSDGVHEAMRLPNAISDIRDLEIY